jgi:diguanylate cyclase (GGDEF)-like protein/PAS domain S-box-containing protein
MAFSLRDKLIGGFLAVVAVLAVLGVVSLMELGTLHSQTTAIGTNVMPSLELLSDMQFQVTDARRLELRIAIDKTADDINKHEGQRTAAETNFNDDLENYKALLVDGEQKYWDDTSGLWAAYEESTHPITALMLKGDAAGALKIINDTLPQYTELLASTETWVAFNDELAANQLKTARSAYLSAKMLTAGVMAFATIFAMTVGFFLERAISKSVRREQQLQMIFDTSPDLIAVYEIDGRYRVANSATTATLGYTQEELLRDGISERIHPDDVAAAGASWRELVRGSGDAVTSMRVRHADGRWIVLESRARALRDESGRTLGIVTISRDITERERAQQTLLSTLAELSAANQLIEEKSAMLEFTLVAERESARRDPLTNALNHGAIAEVIEERVAAGRDPALPCAIIMIDVDGLKVVNDTYGHRAGDAVLVAVADALFRDGAVVGRYGGDEFVALLGGADRGAAEAYCSDVSDELAGINLRDPDSAEKIPVSASLGVAIFPEEAETVADLVRLSDGSMYESKRQRPVGDATVTGRMGGDRSAKMVGELVPLLTSPGALPDKLRLVSHRLSVGAGYDAVNFVMFALTPGAPSTVSTFARVPDEIIDRFEAGRSQELHPLRAVVRDTKRPLIVEDLQHDARLSPAERENIAAAGLTTSLLVPMIWQDAVIGMLAVANRTRPFSAQDVQFVSDVATQVTAIVTMHGLVAELEASTARLAASQDDTVMMLAAAAEAHDHTTGMHLVNIRVLAEALGRELGYSDREIVNLGMAGVLHDIGKISVPDSVLSSPGALEGEQWDVMRRHTVWGAEFLSGKPGFKLAATVARSHHERWDGGGYPDGLSAESIPEAAQIVTVADSFDAMTHDRPYRAGRPVNEAIGEIMACSGKQFSPRVVAALLRLYDRDELPHEHPSDPDELAEGELAA